MIYINFKVSRGVEIIKKFKYLLTVRILQNIYFALIHPYLNYEILAWGVTINSYLSSFTTQQNRVIKMLARVNSSCNNTQSFHKSKKILQINKIFGLKKAKFVLKHNKHQLPLTLRFLF